MSTYSSNLRLELITTGTQAGTWGTTTNTNLGTLLEGAISGYALVTVTSTAQALTANNGAADESRLAMLQLATSGISSAFAVYAPPASKQYTIYNGSSYTATIYNSTVLGNTTAAGTGIAILAGETATIWSNGTSFFAQNTYLPSTTKAATASFGTNTTQLATTAFVQAALQALHPVGSIYTSTASTNPGTLFGFGTWVAYGAGRVLLGNGGGYAAGDTGGSADAIVVSHSHTATSTSSFTGTNANTGTESVGHTHTFSGSTGAMSANASHNHSASDSGHGHGYQHIGTNGPYYQTTIGTGYYDQNLGNYTTNTGYASISVASTNTDHTHSYSGTTSNISANHTHNITPAGSVSTSTTVASSGSSATGANLQPYVVVYMWNRTA